MDDSTSAVDTKTDALIRKAFKEQIQKKLSILEKAYLNMSLEDKEKAEKQIKQYMEILKWTVNNCFHY